jgi:cyclic pyranopterin phosphate synthase
MCLAMIDVSSKPDVEREATAEGKIILKPETIRIIRQGTVQKGDPITIAKVAGIIAAKRTSGLIPLCHPLPLTNVEVEAKIADESSVVVVSTVKAKAKTGVEMEALTATAMALLTIWDMVKQYEKDASGQYPSTAIENIHVVKKSKDAHQ